MNSCHSSPQDCGKRIIGWGQWGLCSEFKVNLSFIESPCLIKQTAEVFKNWNVKPWIFDVFIIQNYLDNHAVEKNPLNKMQKTLTTKTMMNKLDKLKARVGTGELAQWLRACAALAFTWLLPTLVPLRALHALTYVQVKCSYTYIKNKIKVRAFAYSETLFSMWSVKLSRRTRCLQYNQQMPHWPKTEVLPIRMVGHE